MATPKKANPGDSRFKPGKSGNPGGRSPRIGPNGETAAQLARLHTTKAIDTLAAGLDAPDWNIRVQCANSLLQRGWGAPKSEDEGAGKEDIGKALLDLIAALPS